MTRDSDPSSEFDRLLAEATNGQLNDEQTARLNEILSTDPSARERYLDQIHVHSLLTFGNFQIANREGQFESREAFAKHVAEEGKRTGWEEEVVKEFRVTSSLFQQSEIESSGETRQSEPKQRRFPLFSAQAPSWVNSHTVALVTLSMAALIVGALSARSLFSPPDQTIVIQRMPPEQPVAYLASVTGCDWGTGEYQSQTVGSAIRPDQQISLHEGIAEFRLASGVSVSIEGPASFSLTSPSSLNMNYGKLTVHVPWTVTDFVVQSDVCSITACEAEFGLSLSQENAGTVADLHAFSGSVLVVPGVSDRPSAWKGPTKEESWLGSGKTLVRCEVSEGRMLSVTHDGNDRKVSHWGAANETLFATKLPMAWPLPMTREYVNAVKDSKPLGYWRFESQENGRIPNEGAEGGDLRIVGGLRLTGDSSNSVADFNRHGSDCYLLSTKALNSLRGGDQYSVELWFKPSHVQWGGIASLIVHPSTVHEGHAFYLELQGTPTDDRSPINPARFVKYHTGSLRFVHRNPPNNSMREAGSSCFSNKMYSIRRWQHVVAVKSPKGLAIYLNGALLGTQKDAALIPSESPYLFLGRRSTPERVKRYSFGKSAVTFVGQLDEVAVYGRALSEQEIQEHFNSVRWDLDSIQGGPRETELFRSEASHLKLNSI